MSFSTFSAHSSAASAPSAISYAALSHAASSPSAGPPSALAAATIAPASASNTTVRRRQPDGMRSTKFSIATASDTPLPALAAATEPAKPSGATASETKCACARADKLRTLQQFKPFECFNCFMHQSSSGY